MELVPEGWKGILSPGERILWQGRPDGRIDFTRDTIVQAASGLPFLVFGVIWFAMTLEAARQSGIGLLFPAIGIFLICAGLWQVLGTFLNDAWRRRHTWYTLTDRRAFIATEAFGKRELRDWPVDPETLLDYDGAIPGTIWFAEEYRRGRSGRRRVGFEMLTEARQVFEIMRRVQRRQA